MRLVMRLALLVTLSVLAVSGSSTLAGKWESGYRIDISMESWSSVFDVSDWAGTLTARGALADEGTVTAPAWLPPYDQVIRFVGERGTYTVILSGVQVASRGRASSRKTNRSLTAAFAIVDGTGDYEGLSTGGTATGQLSTTHSREGTVNWYALKWTLNGDVGGQRASEVDP